MKNTVFCTLFKDTDKYFGSAGPFSHKKIVKNSDSNWTVNPPYMPNIMMMVYKELKKAFKKIKRDNFVTIILFPKWTNDPAYIKFKNSKYLVKCIEPKEGNHYMNCNGRITYMYGMSNSMFILSKDKSIVTDDMIDGLIKEWDTYVKDDTNQSLFSSPKFV